VKGWAFPSGKGRGNLGFPAEKVGVVIAYFAKFVADLKV